MRTRDQMQPGQWVRSHYKGAGWKGIVLAVYPLKDALPILLVQPLIAAKGFPLHKVKARTLNQYWLRPCDPA